jgi:cyclin A
VADDKLARDIFEHLRVAEIKKRPSTDYMKTVQTEIDVVTRTILVEWLVETVEQCELVPEVLYLAVNYMDRYLSGNNIKHNWLQLLAATCLLIALKHEERKCAPCVLGLCHLMGNRYSKDDVLQMEAHVLKYLKFDVTDPTAKSFLRGLIHIARGPPQLEFLADYIAELSLLEYAMLRYSPSLIAAASLCLANFILKPAAHPWNATLSNYSLYHPLQLCECVEDLHKLLCYSSTSNNFPTIREKYSKLKYMCVAREYCVLCIPLEFFLYPRN